MSQSFASSNLALVSNCSKVPLTPATLTLISDLLAWCGPFVLSPVFLAVLEGKHSTIKYAILEHRHPHFHLTFAFGHEKGYFAQSAAVPS